MAVQLWMRASCNHLPPALMSFLIISLKVNWRQWRSIIGIRYLYSLDKAKDFSTKCFLLTLKHALLNVVTAFLIRCKNFLCTWKDSLHLCNIFYASTPFNSHSSRYFSEYYPSDKFGNMIFAGFFYIRNFTLDAIGISEPFIFFQFILCVVDVVVELCCCCCYCCCCFGYHNLKISRHALYDKVFL